MPSFSIHIACANEFLKNNREIDEKEFLKGVIRPDLEEDKVKSHFSYNRDKNNLKLLLKSKVNIQEYIDKNGPKTDFDLGYLFHLITDYEFYTNFLEDEFILNTTFDEFKKIMYHDYNSINEYLKEKYDVIYGEDIKEYDYSNNDEPIVLKYSKLDLFIVRMSKININNYIMNKGD